MDLCINLEQIHLCTNTHISDIFFVDSVNILPLTDIIFKNIACQPYGILLPNKPELCVIVKK